MKKLPNWCYYLYNFAFVKVHQYIIYINFILKKKYILLKPIPPRGQGGSVEHYYHFLFDLFIPLYTVIDKAPKSTTIQVENIGFFSNILKSIFKDKINIVEKNASEGPALKLIGYNPKVFIIKNKLLNNFKLFVFSNLGLTLEKASKKILLIERSTPPDFFLTDSIVKGGGSMRRSIKNHTQLFHTLKELISKDYEVINIKLEEISFKEQIQYFHEASLVIGQHGAGLGNAIWMDSGTKVIEFMRSPADNHFKQICKTKKITHYKYLEYFAEPHVNVNVEQFQQWFTSKIDFHHYLKK